MAKYSISKIIPLITFLLALAAVVYFMSPANATGKKPPPPPPKTQPLSHSEASAAAASEAEAAAHSESSAAAESASQSNADSMADAAGGSSDNAVAISNVYMSRAFAQDFPITTGCFVGVNAGGDKTTQTKSSGGFLGFTYLSTACHLQTLASAERDVDIVARLQCGDRRYRNAVAFDAPKGTSKREHCIKIKKESLMGAINAEKKKLAELASQYRGERDNAVTRYESERERVDKLEREVSEKRMVERLQK